MMGSVTKLPTPPRSGVAFEPPPPKPAKPRADLHDYEAEQRRKIASIDWSRVHVAGDRRAPLELADRPRWKGWLR